MVFDPAADRIARLRERTKDRPAHARLLEILLALPDDSDGKDEEYAAGAMAESRSLSSLAAQALLEDTFWIRHCADPLPPGWYRNGYPNAYHNYRVAGARAAAVRRRTIEQRGSLEDLLPKV